MVTKRVFVSFDFDNDKTLKDFIVGQARLGDSSFEVADHSLKEAQPERDWETKARQAISRAKVFIVMLEKGFRQSYNDFVKKLHEEKIAAEDLYLIEPSGKKFGNQIAALKSFSIWGFYSGLLVLVVLARNIVLA